MTSGCYECYLCRESPDMLGILGKTLQIQISNTAYWDSLFEKRSTFFCWRHTGMLTSLSDSDSRNINTVCRGTFVLLELYSFLLLDLLNELKYSVQYTNSSVCLFVAIVIFHVSENSAMKMHYICTAVTKKCTSSSDWNFF